ncbi:Kinesin-like protein KIF22-B [Holothuria leucospilota]|uniref:Kinesin-like protein n=1 Tax=Holothuria leucospilota TaxID=206669 RepID=A0A9Q1CDN8_HOLLE|nr:Kinesin-like protein KIF22-B [Holothuria leucospilota]
MASDKGMRVQVAVRLRPALNPNEQRANRCVSGIDNKSLEIWNWRNTDQSLRFEFDAFYGADSQQKDIFKKSVRPLLAHPLEGQNVSVFAYGPTGAGKTFTMLGTQKNPGIIPRSLFTLFREIQRRERNATSSEWKYAVSFSYLEIYQEKVYDLLEIKSHDLPIREDQNHNIFIPNLTSKTISSVQEFQALFEPASKNRTTAATKLNSRSSRSHSVLLVKVEKSRETERELKTQVGKLYLIDLAGSENNKKTGNQGIRLKESGAINMSLFQLGKVVDALNQKLPRIPYRDSKLTRLLQDSLGGHAHACMLTNIAPEEEFYMDTYTTLNFAAKSRNVVNKPFVREISETKKPAKKRSLSSHDDKVTTKKPKLNTEDKDRIIPQVEVSSLIRRQETFEEKVKSRLDNLEQNLLQHLTKVTSRPGTSGQPSGTQQKLEQGFADVRRLQQEIASVNKVLREKQNEKKDVPKALIKPWRSSETPGGERSHLSSASTKFEGSKKAKNGEKYQTGKIQFAKVKSVQDFDNKENASIIRLDPEFRQKHAASILHLLNTGTVKQLKSLQSVGEKRAQLIHNWRQMFGEFTRIEDLNKVTGLPQKTVNLIIQNNLIAVDA